VPDVYPLPRIHHILERLRHARFISTLDLKNARHLPFPACQFFQRSIKYLGHVISEAGIQTDPDKVAAIRELAPPTNLKELRRCLGIASWYRRFFKVGQERPAGKMFTCQVDEPFQILCADLVGPLPRSNQEVTVLLVFLDMFSK
ncbi:hypothetical protein KR054_009038, partial [Drosophila jambulina]